MERQEFVVLVRLGIIIIAMFVRPVQVVAIYVSILLIVRHALLGIGLTTQYALYVQQGTGIIVIHVRLVQVVVINALVLLPVHCAQLDINL